MDNRKKAVLITGLAAFGTGLGLLMFSKKGTELRGHMGNFAKQKVNDLKDLKDLNLKKESPHFAANRSVKNRGFVE